MVLWWDWNLEFRFEDSRLDQMICRFPIIIGDWVKWFVDFQSWQLDLETKTSLVGERDCFDFRLCLLLRNEIYCVFCMNSAWTKCKTIPIPCVKNSERNNTAFAIILLPPMRRAAAWVICVKRFFSLSQLAKLWTLTIPCLQKTFRGDH